MRCRCGADVREVLLAYRFRTGRLRELGMKLLDRGPHPAGTVVYDDTDGWVVDARALFGDPARLHRIHNCEPPHRPLTVRDLDGVRGITEPTHGGDD